MRIPWRGGAPPSIDSRYDRFRQTLGLPLGVERESWPLSLDGGLRRAVQTFAAKAFSSGLEGVGDAPKHLGKAADGFVDEQRAGEGVAAVDRNTRLKGQIKAAPGDAAVHLDNAKAHDAEAKELSKRAEAKRREAAKRKDEEQRLPPQQRLRPVIRKVTVTVAVQIQVAYTALMAAAAEGLLLLGPMLQTPLDIRGEAEAAAAGVALSLLGAFVAIEHGRNLATDEKAPERWRRVLLALAAVFLAAAIVGLVLVRKEAWWVGMAVAATWSIAAIASYDDERRTVGARLVAEVMVLVREAGRLDGLAAGARAAAEGERGKAAAVRAAAADAQTRLSAIGERASATSAQAAARKQMLEGIIETEHARGLAVRRDAERYGGTGRALGLRRRLAAATAAGVIGIGGLAAFAAANSDAAAPGVAAPRVAVTAAPEASSLGAAPTGGDRR
jgi:hypothetical protein